MFTKISVEKVEKGALIITSGEYKASNWTTPKLQGLEIVQDPVFVDGNKRALVTCRDKTGKIIEGCLKTVDDNGWDIIILVTPYDIKKDAPTDFSGEIIVPAIVKSVSDGDATNVVQQPIAFLSEFKKHTAVAIANDVFGTTVVAFDDITEFINISRGDATQVMDLKLHLKPGCISNWRVMKHESDETPVIFPANDSEFGVPELTFQVLAFLDK